MQAYYYHAQFQVQDDFSHEQKFHSLSPCSHKITGLYSVVDSNFIVIVCCIHEDQLVSSICTALEKCNFFYFKTL